MSNNKKGERRISQKRRRKINIMRIVFIAVIVMISIGLVGGSFLFLF